MRLWVAGSEKILSIRVFFFYLSLVFVWAGNGGCREWHSWHYQYRDATGLNVVNVAGCWVGAMAITRVPETAIS